MLMSFSRRFLIWSLSSVLALALFGLALDTGFLRIAGQPKTIENILDRSGVYGSVVPGLLEEAKTINSPSGEIPLTNPIVQSAATTTLSPQFLRTNINQALDSIYLWLNGKTAKPKFTINLDSVKADFADKVAAGAKERAKSLPPCTSLPTSTVDAFNATCLPYGVTPDQVAMQVHESILGGKGFLENTNIQANDIKTKNSNQSVFDTSLKTLPSSYRKFKISPYILLGLVIVLTAASYFIYQPRMVGLRHLGFIFGGTGIFVMLLGLGVNEAVGNKILPHVSLQNRVLETDLRALIQDFVQNLRDSYLWIGLIYLLFGSAAFGVYYYLQRKNPEPAKPRAPASMKVKK